MVATEDTIPPGTDGFFHPESEAELVALVRSAYMSGLQLRVRGASHSVSHAIYPDPEEAMPNNVGVQAPPAGLNMSVMLDRYRGWRVIDEARHLVEADAGIHLGADPSDPTGTATLQTSLMWQLWNEKGWALSETGGISHQTVSGFTATGSSGGSTRFSANHNLYGFRVIDGTGSVQSFSREDDPELFYAMAPAMGLLGVVSTITLECVATFNIAGQEAITTFDGCAIDLLSTGRDRPSFDAFLTDADYARVEWWPQRGVDRVVTWQAQQVRPELGFHPVRYSEFGQQPDRLEALEGILFTILGNLDDLAAAKRKLAETLELIEQALEALAEHDHLGRIGELIAKMLGEMVEHGVDAGITLLEPFVPLIKRELPAFFPKLLDMFFPLDATKPGMTKGEPQSFRDWAWQGLPMDDQANDRLMPTEFSEIWLPLGRASEVVGVLRNWFEEPKDAHEAFRRTGMFAWELYAAAPTSFWMNASYTDGQDEWSAGAFRVDIYWFPRNAADPVDALYGPVWQLLRDAGLPFRLHWGKFQPKGTPGDRTWVDFFRAQYPRWDDFLALRGKRDPNNIFLTDYWRNVFGLWDAPRPTPRV
jgi:hypothetical protein